MGFRCLGGFIGSYREATDQKVGKFMNWVKSLDLFSWITEKEPQAEFSGPAFSLQHDWAYS